MWFFHTASIFSELLPGCWFSLQRGFLCFVLSLCVWLCFCKLLLILLIYSFILGNLILRFFFLDDKERKGPWKWINVDEILIDKHGNLVWIHSIHENKQSKQRKTGWATLETVAQTTWVAVIEEWGLLDVTLVEDSVRDPVSKG